MSLLVLGFSGWAQCRLATDPDPFDEPRGVSGWTCAVAGEPDLDRVIRFQPAGTTPRRFGPSIGVGVDTVHAFGHRLRRHTLLGATVDLLDAPVFDGRNGLAGVERQEAITPFDIRVEAGEVRARRRHCDAMGADLALAATGFEPSADDLRRNAGVADPSAHRAERRVNVERALKAAVDVTERAALHRRLAELTEGAGRALASLRWGMRWAADLAGPVHDISDPNGRIGVHVDPARPWAVDLRIGVWDADALCAWVQGTLSLPLLPPVDHRATVVRLLTER